MQRDSALPVPDGTALEHSRRVAARVAEHISRAGGWISFADYMDLVLYAPGLGYYSAGARKFGAAGDFITAPELGPLFARCIARFAAGVLSHRDESVILEIGGGTGALAADLLESLGAHVPDRYLLLETSADLRERQRETLRARVPALMNRIEWLDRLPRNIRGLVIANEVLDALPVERFTIDRDQALCQGVCIDGGPRWAARPAAPALRDAVADLRRELPEPLPEGYTSEFCLRQPAWTRAVAGCLGQGAVLFVDYGCTRRDYYHPQRAGGTLGCHYRHRWHTDPFLYPGLQDLTAWVDFTAVARAAEQVAGLEVAAYTTQASFLIATGILETLGSAPDGPDPRLAGQARRLLMPGEMGDHFKVLLLTKDLRLSGSVCGLRDLRHTL